MASIASATGARVSFQARLVARWLWLSWCCCAVCVASVRHSALSGLCLTIHSSRRRFAARLNSGVRSSWRKTLRLVNRKRHRRSRGGEMAIRKRLAPLSRSAFLAALTGRPRQAAAALPSLATGRFMGQSRPNNSFKPTPLHGIVLPLPHLAAVASVTSRCGAA